MEGNHASVSAADALVPASFSALFGPEILPFQPPSFHGASLALPHSRTRIEFTLGDSLPDSLRVSAVHGHQIAPVRFPWNVPEADGFFFFGSRKEALAIPPLAISTADCLAVALASQPSGTDFVAFALVHAGWRGYSGGILQSAVHRLVQSAAEAGVSAAALLAAFEVAISPAIFGRSYECGPEVLDALEEHFAEHVVAGSDFAHRRDVAHVYQDCLRVHPRSAPGKVHPDLQLLAICDLYALGLTPANMQVARVNTYGHSELPSFREASLTRADGPRGDTRRRMFSHLLLVPDEADVLPT